ncbi:hypothetical protein SEVIR_7G216500v4 [Setaria viridis]
MAVGTTAVKLHLSSAAAAARRPSLLHLAAVAALCSLSYLFGIWHHGGFSAARASGAGAAVSIATAVSCASPTPTASSSSSTPAGPLDFAAHHTAEGMEEDAAPRQRAYDACPAKYSEYTPCEDVERSLRFSRDRLVYRERHCPSSDAERLRCLVPAPRGYRNPFPWPASRDVAWFANVPHKELTVEKAVQNWIRVDGDKFRFPGGGTMFPRGAGAYIDDIGKIIPLHDGSIRTALDTGCGNSKRRSREWRLLALRVSEVSNPFRDFGSEGESLQAGLTRVKLMLQPDKRAVDRPSHLVASWGAYLLSRNILAMSFAPRDSHEAQVQFALERGVPAMIGVLASNRLTYPARSFDMAHCSRCLIPWQLYDGLYLIEIDRVLRPGGYWILSGPPINWKKHYKGWARSKDDLNQEQQAIEKVAASLCWKKVKEEGDIAIWQKPTNHIHCKAIRKVIKSPPFCSSQNPDAAW